MKFSLRHINNLVFLIGLLAVGLPPILAHAQDMAVPEYTVDPFWPNGGHMPRIHLGCLGEFCRHDPTLVATCQTRRRPQGNNFVASPAIKPLAV